MKEILNSRIYYDILQYFVKWLKYFNTNNEQLKIFEFNQI